MRTLTQALIQTLTQALMKTSKQAAASAQGRSQQLWRLHYGTYLNW